jgi:hypothetical protein
MTLVVVNVTFFFNPYILKTVFFLDKKKKKTVRDLIIMSHVWRQWLIITIFKFIEFNPNEKTYI